MTHPYRPTSSRAQVGGFSLIEVMVAVLVISIGLLGIAKMQALALSNTSNSRLRALAALEAAGLASALQADRGYWISVPVVGTDLTASFSGTAVTAASDTTLTTAQSCANGTTCTAAQMAAYDLQYWVLHGLSPLIPSAAGSIDCTMPAPVAPLPSSPVTCKITLYWNENLVNSNSAQTTSNVTNNTTTVANLVTPQYVLVVDP
jgi:type IV pilus assembly protein PilV